MEEGRRYALAVNRQPGATRVWPSWPLGQSGGREAYDRIEGARRGLSLPDTVRRVREGGADMMSALIVIVLGVWMMLSPLVIPSAAVASWNSWIVGMLGAFNGARLQRAHNVWQATLTYIASACIFVAGFIPRLQAGDELVGRSIIFGALLFIAGICSLGYRHQVGHPAPRIN
jgi:hypothetical protein